MPREYKSVLQSIPTNLITGFLGVGKTTAILNLLQHKPRNQRWAVLVNEFGSVGIDGAIYAARDAFVREVPGGCMCCAAGIPMQVAVNRLLRESSPDRLLIEPSGLGHPYRILDTLSSEEFSTVLQLRASVCLVDPRKLNDSRYTGHETFVDQIALSDILIANKADLADLPSMRRFFELAASSDPRKSVVAQTTNGELKPEWLDLSLNRNRAAMFPDAHELRVSTVDSPEFLGAGGRDVPSVKNSADGYESTERIFAQGTRFNFRMLSDWFTRVCPHRIKGAFLTDKGWFVFNASDGRVVISAIDPASDSRVQIIAGRGHGENLESDLNLCIRE